MISGRALRTKASTSVQASRNARSPLPAGSGILSLRPQALTGPLVFTTAGTRIQRPSILMDIGHEDTGIRLEVVIHSITMVGVDIDIDDTRQASALEFLDQNTDIIMEGPTAPLRALRQRNRVRSRMPFKSSRASPRPVSWALATAIWCVWLISLRKRASCPKSVRSLRRIA